MSDNFRQAVSSIIFSEEYQYLPEEKKLIIDLVCSEVEKLAAGMPEPECCKAGDKGLNNLVFLGAKEYRLTCQAFIRKELQ